MDARPTLRRDLLLAGLLALVLGAVWAWRDWTNLSALHLPDTDDVVRLQQIRDWLGGQAFADVSQHRLAGGMPMHWSRLPDLMPGALIALGTPLMGSYDAMLAAVIAWPLLLFAAALTLVARIARALDVEPTTAMVVAAIAYPATTLFLPGRIDHHGLQMVLLLGAVLAQLRPPSAGAGVAGGLLAAASMTVGLETVPLFAMLGAMAVTAWIAGQRGAAERLGGLGVGALVGLAAAKGLFATGGWTYPACDGFTAQAWHAAVAVAPVPLVLALLDARLTGWRARAAAALLIGGGASMAALAISPGCLSPYGGIDPMLTRLWLSRVGEAQGLFAAPIGTALGYAGVMLVGLGCAAWQWRTIRDARWGTVTMCLVAALLITIDGLRGAYAGALLAAPALAAAITAERARGSLRLAGAWLLSAGMLWPLAADALTPVKPGGSTSRGDCTSPATLGALARMPIGTVMAPVDAGAYLLAGTRQRVIAAPFHRNNAGNRAAYGFFLGAPDAAQATARAWGVRYVMICDGDPATMGAAAGSLAARLADGAAPAWLAPLPAPNGVYLYAVRR